MPAAHPEQAPPLSAGNPSRASKGATRSQGARARSGDSAPRAAGQPRQLNPRDDSTQAALDWFRFTDRFVLQYGSDFVWDRVKRMPMRVSALRLLYGNEWVRAWLASDERRTVDPDEVVFDPTSLEHPRCVNLFGGIAMQPREGDVEPILALLDHVCGGDPRTREFVLNWLALPLQRLGTKMRTALVVHGPEGSGKNLLFEIARDIYGEYGLVVGVDQLEDKFNDWLSKKLFVIGDEVVTRHELRHHKGRLKAMISGRELQINTKMMPLRRETNYVNLVFLSNETQPLELDAGDRRYCVLWTPPAKPKAFYDRIGECLANGGREAFYAYLLRLDLAGFDEFTPPPVSDAKVALIEVGLRPPERFLREWLESLLPLPVRPCTAEQLFRAYRRWCSATGVRWSGEQAAFSNAVRKAGAERLEYRTVNVPDDRGRKAHRCWIPHGTGPVDGSGSLGSWVADAIEAFESDLQRFSDTASGGVPA